MRTFRDFMETALYDPERGFYAVREKSADFYTAPELHGAFGSVLADRLAALLGRLGEGPLTLVEAGCGDGTLACQVARRLREAHAPLCARLSFVLVERNRKDLTEAARRLTAFGLPVAARTSVEKLPAFSGALYSNELIDALPFHVLERRGDEVLELFVDERGEEALKPLSRPELAAPAAAVKDALGDGGRHAVSLEAAAWMSAAAERLTRGFVLTADYGKRFTPDAPNPPRSFRRHALESELTRGSRDLTASADFDALITAGAARGLAVEAYESLSRFLVDGGIERHFAAAAGDDASSYSERAKLKTLMHPEGMGEAFKVLIQRKAI
ncbi:MAG: SAM-dependent methyltransferase [Elusimicrobiota bacterium]|nr:SAM-dependent methyltransferase [Elusimicrobiota bacterium]